MNEPLAPITRLLGGSLAYYPVSSVASLSLPSFSAKRLYLALCDRFLGLDIDRDCCAFAFLDAALASLALVEELLTLRLTRAASTSANGCD